MLLEEQGENKEEPNDVTEKKDDQEAQGDEKPSEDAASEGLETKTQEPVEEKEALCEDFAAAAPSTPSGVEECMLEMEKACVCKKGGLQVQMDMVAVRGPREMRRRECNSIYSMLRPTLAPWGVQQHECFWPTEFLGNLQTPKNGVQPEHLQLQERPKRFSERAAGGTGDEEEGGNGRDIYPSPFTDKEGMR